MRVALEVWSSRYDEVEATCRLAESLGIDAFYYGESPHDLNLDCWTTLGALAASTERIRIGPVITNVLPAYRSPVLLAKQAATVAVVSRGRLDLRTGVGASATFARRWWEPFGIDYPDYDRRLADLRNALEALPGLWAGERRDAAGGPITMLGTRPPTIPVTIAARGDRAMHLAADHGDVWETSFCTPAEFRIRQSRMLEILAGREITRSLEIDGFVSTTPPALDRLLRRVRTERGRGEDLDPILERALLGVPEEAAQQLLELADAGVDQVVVALHDPHDVDAVEAIAEAARIVRDLDCSA